MGIKENILAAGESLLREKGVASLTQPQVAKAAGIKQSHLTYYFPTRAELLLGIAEQSIRATMKNLAARLEEKPLRATLADTVAKVMISGLPPRVMLGLIVAADTDPDIRKPLRKLLKYARVQMQALLAKAGLEAGTDAALLFHATVVGLAVMHQAQMNSTSSHDIRSGIATILHLLAPESSVVAKGGSI
jgi:AcrR family transcriptional regulator